MSERPVQTDSGTVNSGKWVYVLSFTTAILFVSLWISISSPEGVFARLPEGFSARALSKKLNKDRVLLRERIFLTVVTALKIDRNLRYGTYRFYEESPVFNIIKELKMGMGLLFKITIPEGFRAQQIAARLEANQIVNAEAFMYYVEKHKLEGYLFPETYYFPPSDSPERVCGVFKAQFDKVFQVNKIAEKSLQAGLTSVRVVILASIIEREAATDEEKFLISGIFHNRMGKRMRLESCSTVRYALKKWKRPLSIDDTLFKSPYNTYRRRGLPPGPICSPGLAALLAAVEPVQTDLLFFVVDASGKHNFSKYFKQHRKKKFRAHRKK